MAQRRKPRLSDGIYDVNMTPLIDVSLVLVVILMVATPMAFQSGIAVSQAAATGKKAAETAHVERVELEVLSNDAVRVNDRTVPRQALDETLRPLLNASATRRVVVRCGDAVSHGAFVGVLDEARECGASQIAVVGGAHAD